MHCHFYDLEDYFYPLPAQQAITHKRIKYPLQLQLFGAPLTGAMRVKKSGRYFALYYLLCSFDSLSRNIDEHFI